MIGKHTEAAQKIKQLEQIISEKDAIIARKDREIIEIKTECADQFKKIKNLCFINEYGDKYLSLRKILEIATDNFSQLLDDLAILQDNEKAKIIELPTNRKIRR